MEYKCPVCDEIFAEDEPYFFMVGKDGKAHENKMHIECADVVLECFSDSSDFTMKVHILEAARRRMGGYSK